MTTDAPAVATAPIRLGVVSFVNTLPLIDGLEDLDGLALKHSVPSLLVDQLLAGEVDIALCSSIDYQRSREELLILPVGMLGCDGPTLTVRLYSTTPLAEITDVYCDTDSHTSVALLRILLRERLGIDPAVHDYNAREHTADHKPLDWPDAMLLIGDKVVTDSPPAIRYPHQLDLGAAWQEWTGLPFVFAVWMARATIDRERLMLAASLLDRQRRHNVERIDRMVHHRAVPRDWPADLAADYLKQKLRYELDDRAIAGLELFYDEAKKHGLIETRRPARIMS
ncbi:MAG: hypothetical protein EA377_02680 [Phycisphaerales bacterium]|nr:MAG: hypothetical protein EA377_02680 [Phycisphaerales bacterium]